MTPHDPVQEHDPVREILLRRMVEALRAHSRDGSAANTEALEEATEAMRLHLKARGDAEQVRRARKVSSIEQVVLPAMSDTDEATESSAMHDTELTAEQRQQAVFDKEKAECDRFVAEFGGEYNSGGTRHRVMLYYEDMRRIAEMCRFFRDTAITESIQVDDGVQYEDP